MHLAGVLDVLCIGAKLIVQLFPAFFPQQVSTVLVLLSVSLEVAEEVLVVLEVAQLLPYSRLHLLVLFHHSLAAVLLAPVLIGGLVLREGARVTAKEQLVVLFTKNFIAQNGVRLGNLLEKVARCLHLLLRALHHVGMVLLSEGIVALLDL